MSQHFKNFHCSKDIVPKIQITLCIYVHQLNEEGKQMKVI